MGLKVKLCNYNYHNYSQKLNINQNRECVHEIDYAWKTFRLKNKAEGKKLASMYETITESTHAFQQSTGFFLYVWAILCFTP